MDIDPCLKKGVFSEWGMKAPLEAKQKSFNDMKNEKKNLSIWRIKQMQIKWKHLSKSCKMSRAA